LASVDVGVALLGYGTVGSSVARMLAESGDEIERATGHRLTLVRALVRDPRKERAFSLPDGVLTTEFTTIRDDPAVNVVAEVMGGIAPAGDYVRQLLRAGKPVVSANKQLVAREGSDLFATASEAGVQLRFEASVCAAIPVVKILRESLIATNVHRVLGIVNGTTNFILSQMERGETYGAALAAAQQRGYAEADPTDDVEGLDAAAKMAILATVAFGSRVAPDEVETVGITEVTPAHVAAAAELGMVVRLVGIATLAGEEVDVRVQPAFVDRAHPLAAVDGAFNAVMLQGDAIREITLEGPGAGGVETASAVVADLVSVVGTAGTGFLQNDACWRELRRLDPAQWRSPFYVHLDVADRPGVLAHASSRLAAHDVSVAQLVQRPGDGRASLDVVLHRAPLGRVRAALAEISAFPEVLDRPFLAPVISEKPL
jgi:homoserine dehydrogenase